MTRRDVWLSEATDNPGKHERLEALARAERIADGHVSQPGLYPSEVRRAAMAIVAEEREDAWGGIRPIRVPLSFGTVYGAMLLALLTVGVIGGLLAALFH